MRGCAVLITALMLVLADGGVVRAGGEAPPPVRLSVPRLRLHSAPIIPVPIVNGVWDEARLGAREVGLLHTTGRWPNDALAIVLVGHVTLEGEQAGPFYGLGSLRAGDFVLLRTQDNRLWRYQVTQQYLLRPSDVKAIYRQDGRRLLLLTCASWDEDAQAYAQRLVVEAELLTVAERQPALPLFWRYHPFSLQVP